MTWYLIAALFLVGLWGVIALNNVIRKVIGLTFMNSAIILFFVYYGSIGGRRAPILADERATTGLADPLPQALMLTAIVVGICVVAVALVIVFRLYQRFGTLDIRELERRAWGGHE